MSLTSLSPDKEPESCAFCAKKGLPIVPVRYALARNSCSAPRLGAPFKIEDLPDGKDLSISGGKTHYTLRSLRYGYLYTYDEARKYWRAYLVAHGGYFMEFDINQPLPPAQRSCRPCSREGHPQKASFVTVSNPKEATKVWFGYSDVEWTQGVLQRHQSESYRERHMRAFDVKAWLERQDQSEALPVTRLAESVAEYCPGTKPGNFVFSAAMYYRYDAASMVETAERIYPGKAAIVGLHDPAAVAMDLAALMESRLKKYVTHDSFKRPLAASAAVMQLEAGVKSQAELRLIQDYTRDASRVARIGEPGMGGRGANAGVALRRAVSPELDGQYDRLEASVPTKTMVKQARTEAWEKYAEKVNEPARAAWQNVFDEKLREFDNASIAPLAKLHAQWMGSKRIQRSFECNYDENDVDSGGVYQHVVTLCIAGTQDKKACFDLYARWLQGTFDDKKNLLLRAMLLNQQALLQQAQSAASKASTDLSGLPWDQLFTLYDEAAGRLGGGWEEAIGKLVTAVSGPAVGLLGKVMDGAVSAGSGLVALGVATRTRFNWVTVGGSNEDMIRAVMKAMEQMSGRPASRSQVELELRRLRVYGAPLEQRMRMRVLGVQLDGADGIAPVVRMDRFLSTQTRFFRRVIDTEVRTGVGAGLVQVALVGKAFGDMLDAMGHEKWEVRARLGAMVTGMAGTFSEATGKALTRSVRMGLRYGQGVAEMGGKLLTRWGARAAVMGGVVMALADFWAAGKAWTEGEIWAASLFLGSGVVSLTLTMAIAAAWGLMPIAILIALSFAIAALIAMFVDDKIENWLERSYWGKPKGDIRAYPRLDIEMKQLNLATQS